MLSKIRKMLRPRTRLLKLAQWYCARYAGGPSQGGTAAAPDKIDFSVLLHGARTALLREMPKGADTLLSAGCSGGWYFQWFDENYGPIPNHIGVELYSPKPTTLPDNVTWISCSVGDISPVADGSCDLVFSGQNIEHLLPADITGFLTEAARLVRIGGHLVMDSPNRSFTEPLGWDHPEHMIEFTVPEIRRLVTLAGFDVVKLAGIWLCRENGHLLPLEAPAGDGVSLTSRLVGAANHPDNSFIWWLEARRSVRKPDTAGIAAAVASIYEGLPRQRKDRINKAVTAGS